MITAEQVEDVYFQTQYRDRYAYHIYAKRRHIRFKSRLQRYW